MCSTENRTASALGGKTARACDNCMRRRARWYCAADDAFLCQACDSSVHSANPLARRHQRLRLKTSSFRPIPSAAPAWTHGFTRKARTPRKHTTTPPAALLPHKAVVVPEIGSDNGSEESEEEQLLYRVPIFDPDLAEFCSSNNGSLGAVDQETEKVPRVFSADARAPGADALHVLLPTDTDLAEFAANVESLLGRGLDEDECTYCIDGLGFFADEEEKQRMRSDVKLEEMEEEVMSYDQMMMEGETELTTLEFDFETGEGEEKTEMKAMDGCDGGRRVKKISLRLNHEAVIDAWSSGGSPWTDGRRPQFDSDDCWPDFLMGIGGGEVQGSYGGMIGGARAVALGGGGGGGGGDGGREARVSRYREKRRTRLFSKKIRYEVRKLNAEKRPRMKGRFVKRSSFVGAAASAAVVGGGGPTVVLPYGF
ncbi:Zinc finger protein CONSTANS-LIKE 16 [Acorus calamus]|uniref:Zinc finger protein CONSTANS-LIKE 16 n=1 Tax=Acorus calamus TaxID=4465 RepID=A0AAV9DNH8_ACOCL|nr:Zinc finger protein CONSTANS-LIKE 16 [Acorus calamus]